MPHDLCGQGHGIHAGNLPLLPFARSFHKDRVRLPAFQSGQWFHLLDFLLGFGIVAP